MKSTCPDPDRLRQLLDETLPAGEQKALQAHLEGCKSCQRALEGLVAGKESWSNAAEHLAQADAGTLQEPALRKAQAELVGKATVAESSGQGAGNVKSDDLSFLSPATRPGSLGRLGHYEILAVLGRGGFGVVLKAQDDVLDRVVAIKALALSLASNATARRRFEREAKAAAAISHDHVVGIHAVDEANGVPYIAMQLIAGISLQQRLDESGPLRLTEILRIGMQTAAGLAAAHAQGLVHRDIKPANILLENGIERVKITDFGLARAVDDATMTQSGTVAGTPMYMSPEQAEGLPIDHRSDLFSLGTVLYAMCAGHPPFRASGTHAVLKRVIEAAPRPVREINPEIPDWLEAIIAKLHAKKPHERFQTAREVAELLGQHLAHVQQPATAPRPPNVQPPPRGASPAEPQQPSLAFLLVKFVAIFVALAGMGIGVFILCVSVAVLFGSSATAFTLVGVGLLAALCAVAAALIYLITRQRPARASVPSPAAPKTVGRRRWRLVFVPIALLLVVALVIFAVFRSNIQLYVSNTGELGVSRSHPEFEEFYVESEDRGPTTRSKINPHEPLTLPPGKYRFEAVSRKGATVTQWEEKVSGLFSGNVTYRDGIICTVDLKRGERVGLQIANWDVPDEESRSKEVEKLQGTWRLVSEVRDGERSDVTTNPSEWVIAGDRVTHNLNGKVFMHTRFRLPPSSGSKVLDLLESADSGVSDRVSVRFIYTLEQDRLTLSFVARSKDFLTGEEDAVKVVRVYQRYKPQENEAEKLFRSMEQKIRTAKTLRLRFDLGISELNGKKWSFKGTLVLGEGDKLWAEVEGNLSDEVGRLTVVGDGADITYIGHTKWLKKDNIETDTATKKSPKGLGAFFRGSLPHNGYYVRLTEMGLPPLQFKLSDFKLAGKEKVGGRDTQVIQYKLKVKIQPTAEDTDVFSMKVWLDAQTGLPAKLTGTGNDGEVAELTETYREFNIDGKVDAKLFELPK
jgi:uncharacterized protein (TIGR03067 family)